MNCKIVGGYIQHLEVEMMPNDEFYAERGALIYLEQGIDKNVEFTGGSALTKLFGASMSGESRLVVHYRNISGMTRKLIIGSKNGLVHVKLQNESIICHPGVYVASSAKVNVTVKLSIAGLFGGMGLKLQKITGNGTVFLDCKGQPIVKELGYGDVIEVDENHVIALQGISEGQITSAWNLKNMFGGEGVSMLRIAGPGRVYLSPGSMKPLVG